MSDILKQQKELEKINKLNEVDKLQTFTARFMNKQPDNEEVKLNPAANNSKYIPISFVENKLDELFFGLWQTENFKYQVVVNEVIGSLDLIVFHPAAKTWLRRTGAASFPIQLRKGSGVTQVDQKIHKTLVKDFPHLKAECIKNAARSLGKAFGRDLNRQFEDMYVPLIRMPENDPINDNQVKIIERLLRTSVFTPEQKTAIEQEMFDYTYNQASMCIVELQKNQHSEIIDDINRPNHLPKTQSVKQFEDKINDDKS